MRVGVTREQRIVSLHSCKEYFITLKFEMNLYVLMQRTLRFDEVQFSVLNSIYM